jgi:hypothetical protein
MKQNTDANPFDAEPPRQETDLYGEPVAEEQIGEKFWEAYSDDSRPDTLFVAYYEWSGGEWVKHGMDRHRVSNLFNHDGWPTDD